MFRHTLMLLVATGSLADRGFLKGRRQNYNSNVNYNEFDGFGSGPGSEVGSGRDRGGLYGGSPKYTSVPGPDMVNSDGRGGLFRAPKYVKGRSGSGGLGSGYLASGNSGYGGGYGRENCDRITDLLFREDDVEQAAREEPTDNDGSLKGLFDGNDNYNVIFKSSNRRYLSQRPDGGSADSWGGNTASSNAVGSKLRRTYNWGTLRPAYSKVVDDDRDSRRYDRNNMLYDRTEQDYDRSDRGTNMNSNANYNVWGGRRGNINSNVNNNVIGYGGYGQDHGNKRYDGAPSYSGYDQGLIGLGDYEAPGSYGGHTTSGNPTIGYTPRPVYLAYRDSNDMESEDEDDDPTQSANVNTNANSNVNVMSRRRNVNSRPNKNLISRNKRSVKKSSNVSGRLEREGKRESSTPSNRESNTAPKPVTEKWKNPRSSP